MSPQQFDQLVAIEKTVQLSPWQAAQFAPYQKPDQHMGFVYLDENEYVLGYWLGQIVIDELHLHNISVAKSAQGQGLGGVLLHHFLTTAKNLCCESAWLEVRESNQKAIGLYQKHGFSQVGRRKNYYAHPDLAQREAALIFQVRM